MTRGLALRGRTPRSGHRMFQAMRTDGLAIDRAPLTKPALWSCMLRSDPGSSGTVSACPVGLSATFSARALNVAGPAHPQRSPGLRSILAAGPIKSRDESLHRMDKTIDSFMTRDESNESGL